MHSRQKCINQVAEKVHARVVGLEVQVTRFREEVKATCLGLMLYPTSRGELSKNFIQKVKPYEQIHFTTIRGGLNYSISIEQRFAYLLIMF